MLRRAFKSVAMGRMILSRKERKASVRTSMWEDDESGYEGKDVEPFPFCLVGEEFRCVLGVRYNEDKTGSVWRGSNTYYMVND
jgi:hypothetical protein